MNRGCRNQENELGRFEHAEGEQEGKPRAKIRKHSHVQSKDFPQVVIRVIAHSIIFPN